MDSKNNELVNSILDVSAMSYGMPPMPSISVARRIVDCHAQTTSASQSGNLIFTLNTGDMFLYGKTSYMKLRLNITGGDSKTYLSSYGVYSLFSSIVVSARNGVEITRVVEPALLQKMEFWTMTHDKLQLVKDSEGHGLQFSTNGEVDLVFRLDCIPFFNQENLIPSMVCEGLRIQFTLNTVTRAFKVDTAPVTGFTVTPVLKLDCITLADNFLRAVSQNSANEGLVLMHKEYFHSQNSATISAVNFNINKSCSKATSFIMISRESSKVDDSKTDCYLSNKYDYNRIQLQCGSVFYPNSPLEQQDMNALYSREPYHYVLTNLSPNYNCAVRYNEKFHIDGDAVFGQNLKESNNRGQLTGILLNNSRSLLVSATMANLGTENVPNFNRIFNCYLEHVRLVRVFSNNVVVRD